MRSASRVLERFAQKFYEATLEKLTSQAVSRRCIGEHRYFQSSWDLGLDDGAACSQ